MELIDKSRVGQKKSSTQDLLPGGQQPTTHGTAPLLVLPPSNPREVLNLKRKLDISNSLGEVKETGHALATAAGAAMAASAIA